jgi:hypothetical protein
MDSRKVVDLLGKFNQPKRFASNRTRFLFALLVVFSGLLLLTINVFAAEALDAKQCVDKDQNSPGTFYCDWTPGNIQAGNWVEGSTSFQRFIIDTLVAGQVYTFTFTTTFTDGTAHGYDFITSWDQGLEAYKDYINPGGLDMMTCSQASYTGCSNLISASSYYTDIVVPDDPFTSGTCIGDCSVQSKINEFEGRYGNRTIQLRTLGSITYTHMATPTHHKNDTPLTPIGPTGGDTGTGQTVTKYTVTFQTNSTAIMLLVAPHFAIGGNAWTDKLGWGYGTVSYGAGGLGSGSSWHVRNFQILGGTDPNWGNMDNQANLADGGGDLVPLASTPVVTLTNLTARDVVTMTKPASNSPDIGGVINFYVCADRTPPFTNTYGDTNNLFPNGCISSVGGTGYTTTHIGSVTVNGTGVNNQVLSPLFTAPGNGYYCFMAAYSPTVASFPQHYIAITDSNSSECFFINQTTAVKLSSFNGTNTENDWTFAALGIVGLMGSVALVGAWRKYRLN